MTDNTLREASEAEAMREACAKVAENAYGHTGRHAGAAHKIAAAIRSMPLPTTQPTDNTGLIERLAWIQHNGGDCPAGLSEQLVETITRDGSTALMRARAIVWRWDAYIHEIGCTIPREAQVIKYRLATLPTKNTGLIERLCRELDITNADHIAMWLEENTDVSNRGWLACRIIDAHEDQLAVALATKDAEIAALRDMLNTVLRETRGPMVGGGDGGTFIVRTLTGETCNRIQAALGAKP